MEIFVRSIQISLALVPNGPMDKKTTIGLGTGAALSGKKTIVGNIDDPVY